MTPSTEGKGGGPPGGPAPAWRREPYRLFFPLGVLLAWGGVLHWLLHALGVLPDYHPVFHAIAQIQGFMMCFAVGFLFTAIPRRTGTAPPGLVEMLVALQAPVGTTVAAWFQRWAVSQLFWLSLVAVLVPFAIRRFRSAGARRRPPNSFVWVPLSLLIGAAGSFLTGAPAFLGQDWFWAHDMGRLMLLQGMFLGLIVGVGGMVLPLITCGDAPPDGATTSRDRRVRLAHVAAALLLVTSFWMEVRWSLRGGLWLRCAVVLAVLLASGRIHRRPRVPGWHRRLVWLSAWTIPAGYALAALFPAEKKAGLHVVFLGGFALMAMSVGVHVVLAHGGFERLVRGRPWQVPVFGGLIGLAMVMRALVDFDAVRFFPWLGAASAAFLAGTLFWAWLVLPRLWRRAPQ